ncbi:MBL fold metallo-hydrolase [Aeromonas veronii]|uniref:MBL fold metallo-hydrolase n=1 Tax=Aeromonas veronii TaxID=654 RepID=UPI003D24249B
MTSIVDATLSCVEVILFGPGYGESILINIGDSKWIVVDSCIGENKKPAALNYLESIGGSPLDVILVVATHWHDDHIRGLGDLIEQCSNADFCCSSVFNSDEFHSFVLGVNSIGLSEKMTSGVREINKVFQVMSARSSSAAGNKIYYSAADRRIFELEADNFSHGLPVALWTLSPSDDENSRFMKNIGRYLPKEKALPKLAAEIHPNDTCTVIQVLVGDQLALLFGADLEDRHNGWGNIVASRGRPKTKSLLFKVPHHGSITGNNDLVWDDMLHSEPICILTPYSKGGKLPQDTDITRILGKSARSYTSQGFTVLGKVKKRNKFIDEEIAKISKPIGRTTKSVGRIKVVINDLSSTADTMLKNAQVTFENGARHLSTTYH